MSFFKKLHAAVHPDRTRGCPSPTGAWGSAEDSYHVQRGEECKRVGGDVRHDRGDRAVGPQPKPQESETGCGGAEDAANRSEGDAGEAIEHPAGWVRFKRVERRQDVPETEEEV